MRVPPEKISPEVRSHDVRQTTLDCTKASMRTIATILVLTGIAVSAAQAQIIDGVPTGAQVVDGVPVTPKHGEHVLPADSLQVRRMAVIPLLKCPMPVSHGIVRDSSAVVRPREHGTSPRRPIRMPTQRANCVNPLFAER